MSNVSATMVLEISERFGIPLKKALDMAYCGLMQYSPYPPELYRKSRESIAGLGKMIRKDGIDGATFRQIQKLSKEILYGETILERFPQRVMPGLAEGSQALCAAALVCGGCPETITESREIYDTEDLIGEGLIQEQMVEAWAKRAGCWMEHPEQDLSSLSELRDEGTESVVFFSPRDRVVYKMISLKHYNVLRLLIDRIVIHNAVFPDSTMTVLGFGKDSHGVFVTIIRQPYIIGRKASEEERISHMLSIGFHEAGMDCGMHLNYADSELYVGDVNEYNAIWTPNGLSVIDADCRLNYPTLGCGGALERTINNG